jgi:trehalose synthase
MILVVYEVALPTIDPAVLAPIVGPQRIEELAALARDLDGRRRGRSVVSVNSTETGGGVAEMLHVLVPYARGLGIDARWIVIDGDADFFAITKRLHNHIYGTAGDGGPMGPAEHEHYEAVQRANGAELAAVVRPGDIVLLHDPQTAGLAARLHVGGAKVVWRCHIGSDTTNDWSEAGWEFLRPYLEPPAVDAYVFSRTGFAPPWIDTSKLRAIAPSIDPFATKNVDLDAETVTRILVAVGLIAGPADPTTYVRGDGATRRIEHGCDVIRTGPPPGPDTPLVVQVSRWDRLKDMIGVLHGFADYVVENQDAQLVLAGPVVTAVADDPEGADALRECWDAWRQLPHHARSRVQIACLPMSDPEENAAIVNALQHHAAVVVQKSLAEGFGLTVSEAMFKSRPIVASAVGGLVDQVVDGDTGILLPDPTDLRAFGAALDRLLADGAEAARMGARGRQRVVEHFLPDRQLRDWLPVIERLLDG